MVSFLFQLEKYCRKFKRCQEQGSQPVGRHCAEKQLVLLIQNKKIRVPVASMCMHTENCSDNHLAI